MKWLRALSAMVAPGCARVYVCADPTSRFTTYLPNYRSEASYATLRGSFDKRASQESLAECTTLFER